MGNSLRDQLLKAGLVDEKRAQEAEREERKQRKQRSRARKSGQRTGPSSREVAREKTARERARQAEESRARNRARDEERSQRAVKAQVKQLLDEGAVPHGAGDVRYNFVAGTKIKRIYVDREQQGALARGELCITNLDGRYRLVPAEVVEKIRERMPEVVVYQAEPDETDPDDPYADFPIPEDLDW